MLKVVCDHFKLLSRIYRNANAHHTFFAGLT
jgi:hypothetical protein